jgi:hypothetical protein
VLCYETDSLWCICISHFASPLSLRILRSVLVCVVLVLTTIMSFSHSGPHTSLFSSCFHVQPQRVYCTGLCDARIALCLLFLAGLGLRTTPSTPPSGQQGADKRLIPSRIFQTSTRGRLSTYLHPRPPVLRLRPPRVAYLPAVSGPRSRLPNPKPRPQRPPSSSLSSPLTRWAIHGCRTTCTAGSKRTCRRGSRSSTTHLQPLSRHCLPRNRCGYRRRPRMRHRTRCTYPVQTQHGYVSVGRECTQDKTTDRLQ